METRLAPAIIVLNRNYFPRDSIAAARVGASSFALSVLEILYGAKALGGVVLYKRDEDLTEAHYEVEPNLWDSIPVVTVSFNFHMVDSTVASTLSCVFAYITRQERRTPIIYYQTDTLLQYHPKGFQFCVTHHGPFVAHFTQTFSSSLARLAFGGDSNKVSILQQQQQSGINRLLRDGNFGNVLVHSGLQHRFLKEQGLQSSRFKRLRPPIGVPQCGNPYILPLQIILFVKGADILLFTAVARLDFFKNVELMVEAGLELLNRNVPVRVLVVGDPEDDNDRRQALLDSIPSARRHCFLAIPRLPKDQLYALFFTARRNGIFLCPSRYETLGITPLEAAASGVTTLINDSSNVEAQKYIPPCCRINMSSDDVATKVQTVHRGGIETWANMVKTHVRAETSLDGFGEDLLSAWAEMSRPSSVRPLVRHVGQDTKLSLSNWMLSIRYVCLMAITLMMAFRGFEI